MDSFPITVERFILPYQLEVMVLASVMDAYSILFYSIATALFPLFPRHVQLSRYGIVGDASLVRDILPLIAMLTKLNIRTGRPFDAPLRQAFADSLRFLVAKALAITSKFTTGGRPSPRHIEQIVRGW